MKKKTFDGTFGYLLKKERWQWRFERQEPMKSH